MSDPHSFPDETDITANPPCEECGGYTVVGIDNGTPWSECTYCGLDTRNVDGDGFREFAGSYAKIWYDVKLPDGSVHQHVWPNAGKLGLNDGRKFDRTSGVRIRKSATYPFGDGPQNRMPGRPDRFSGPNSADDPTKKVVIVDSHRGSGASLSRAAIYGLVAAAAMSPHDYAISNTNREYSRRQRERAVQPLEVTHADESVKQSRRQRRRDELRGLPKTEADLQALARAEEKRRRRAAKRGGLPE